MRYPQFKNIRIKIFLLLLTGNLLSLFFAFSLITKQVNLIILNDHRSGQMEILQTIASNVIEDHKRDMERLMHLFAADENLIRVFEDPAAKEDILDNWNLALSLFPTRAWIYYGSTDNEMLVRPHWDIPADYDCRSRPWYLAAMQKEEPVWPTAFIDVATGKHVISIASKIKNRNGVTTGVLAIDTFLNEFLDQIIIQAGETNIPIFILTDTGDIIGNDLFHELNSSFSQLIKHRNPRDLHLIELDKEQYSLSMIRVDSMQFTIGSLINEEILQQKAQRVRKALLFFSLLALLISLITAWILSRYFAGNIEKLYKYTRELTAPDSELRICVKGKDELNYLNRSINLMVRYIRKRETEIQYLNAQLKNQVIRDKLTGSFNRYHLEDQFPRYLKRSEREQKVLAVILVDVDHFKSINDSYGHTTGDFILKELCILIQEHIRSEDTLFRIGGEEFIILSLHNSKDSLFSRAEEIRKVVESFDFHLEKEKINVTISTGISLSPDHGSDRMALQDKADKALYQAKSGGRNRVVVFTEQNQVTERTVPIL